MPPIPIIRIVLTLAFVGVLTWILVTYVPMREPFQRLIIGAALLFSVLWLGRIMGLF
jgi:hypothetical protein